MPRNATGIVKTIGIEIGENSLHLVGLGGCLGSRADENSLLVPRRLSGAEPTKSAEKQTYDSRHSASPRHQGSTKVRRSG